MGLGLGLGLRDLPPSSRVTGVRCLAAAAITMRPTEPLPVYLRVWEGQGEAPGGPRSGRAVQARRVGQQGMARAGKAGRGAGRAGRERGAGRAGAARWAYMMWSHLCASSAVVSAMPPWTRRTASGGKYLGLEG